MTRLAREHVAYQQSLEALRALTDTTADLEFAAQVEEDHRRASDALWEAWVWEAWVWER